THPRSSEGAGEPRGEGFELRTDASGALRAAKGLLVTAYERAEAGSGHLDHAELVKCVKALAEVVTALTDTAAQHQAPATEHPPREALVEALEKLGAGANDRSKDSGAKPILAMTAPEGIVIVSPESVLMGAGKNLEAAAEGHQHFSAAKEQHLTAGKGISLFTVDGGITEIAHRGPFKIQAQHDDVIVNAERNVNMIASQGDVVHVAKKRIVLQTEAGGALVIDGGKISLYAPDGYFVYAKTAIAGAQAKAGKVPSFANVATEGMFRLVDADDGTTPVGQRRYRIKLEDGEIIEGTTGADGLTKLMQRDALRIAKLEVLNDDE
ncbi:MAG TPA: DUF2345 domain-containing protein, partial [Hymenobacter sp.]|nr:DUF2345 domain-containing protein [Hymenobacter sp.]